MFLGANTLFSEGKDTAKTTKCKTFSAISVDWCCVEWLSANRKNELDSTTLSALFYSERMKWLLFGVIITHYEAAFSEMFGIGYFNRRKIVIFATYYNSINCE